MICAEATVAGPTVTEWAQTIVTIFGIIIAAAVAVRVAAKQHERQVIHQTKKDVADALVTFEIIKQAFFEVKLMAEFSVGDGDLGDHDRDELKEVVERVSEPVERLASLTQLLELTAPDLIAMHGRNLLREVRAFRALMMTSFHAYVRADIKRKLGQAEPLGRLTTQAEYESKWASLETAERLLVLATKDYERFTSPVYRIKIFFVTLWFRGSGFVRTQWKRAVKGAGAGENPGERLK